MFLRLYDVNRRTIQFHEKLLLAQGKLGKCFQTKKIFLYFDCNFLYFDCNFLYFDYNFCILIVIFEFLFCLKHNNLMIFVTDLFTSN